MKGYYKQWTDGKYVLGCALFVVLFAPCAILSKLMQHDDLQILAGVIKSIKELDKLKSKPLSQWPKFAATLSKCADITYQCQEFKNFSIAKVL